MSKIIVKGIANSEREIMVYDKKHEKHHVKVFVRNKYAKITKDQFKQWRSNLKYTQDAPVMIVNDNKKQTLKEFSKEIIAAADELKSKTNGLVNMYITGRYSKTALHYYFTHCFNKLNLTIEPIKFEEAIWIDKASTGAYIYAKQCKNVKAYSYDYVSYYPSIMKDNKMLFPIKQGEFKTLTQEEFNKLTFFQYGIFRATVKKSNDEIDKLFMFKSRDVPKQYYTHIELTLAKDLGLQINIIEDGDPNFLYYKRDSLVSGKVLFGEYIDYFYALKNQNVKGAKKIMNCLWGALGESNLKTIPYNIFEEDDLHGNNQVVEMIATNEEGTEGFQKVVDPDKYFEYDLARIKPFLLAKGRKKISETIKPYVNNLLYAHTDSLIVDKPIDIKTGTNIGDLMYEGYCENFRCKHLTCKTSKTKFIK